jgi:hypothetical protein
MKLKASNSTGTSKNLIAHHEYPIWITFPRTIKLLQNKRSANPRNCYEEHTQNTGFNATIILLSAASIEGFLVESLTSIKYMSKFKAGKTFQDRLDNYFLKKVAFASFKDFPELFELSLGRPISKLIKDEELIAGIKCLIDLRNAIAHGRSVSWQYFSESDIDLKDDDASGVEFYNPYDKIYAYLLKYKLVKKHDDIFKNKVADHFSSIIKPYMNAVAQLLPPAQSKKLTVSIAFAFREVSFE